jgi:hypothetical protein
LILTAAVGAEKRMKSDAQSSRCNSGLVPIFNGGLIMGLKIGEKAIVTAKVCNMNGFKMNKEVIVRNLKWNLVLVEFENGEQNWIDGKYVKHTSPPEA